MNRYAREIQFGRNDHPFSLSGLCRLVALVQNNLHRLLQPTRKLRLRHSLANVIPSEMLEARQMLSAVSLQAFHRSGQTFLTWTEDNSVAGEKYHVYRHNAAITSVNLNHATKLTTKWGPLDDNTSVHQFRASETAVPTHFVINDLGAPLSDNQGLFVFTTQANQSGNWYYAVTQVTNGTENIQLIAGSNSLTAAVQETFATAQPVLTVSVNSGKGRIYTQYMDYMNWNPTFQGYVYNYSVALPQNYDPGKSWPLKLMPHAYGERFRLEPVSEYDWPSIQLFPDDSGGTNSRLNTWWYGFSSDHNYLLNGTTPVTGNIENFTEQRVLKAIDEVIAGFNVDSMKIHSEGHSMGASGSLALGMRYGNIFSAIYGSEPMTNYLTSPSFQTNLPVLWGAQSSNLPIVNRGIHAAHLSQYNGMGVYDWMNHQEQLNARRGEEMAFLMIGHGKADDVIDWATQGRPIIAALSSSRVGFSSEQRDGWDHNWMGYDFALNPLFSTAGGLSEFAYPRNLSFIAVSDASGSGPIVPATTGTDVYNLSILWSVPWSSFHSEIVDIPGRYEVSLKSTTISQVATITPRRLQGFRVSPGQTVVWSNTDNYSGQIIQSGTVTTDSSGLVTIPLVQIGTGTGNRLILTSSLSAPTVTGPAASTENQKPLFTWDAVSDAATYNLWIKNLSTGANPFLSIMTAATSWSPAASLGIGKYRIWVQAIRADGQKSTWSLPRDLQINTASAMTAPTASVLTDLPLFTWDFVPGAARYDLWVDNTSTGQSQIIRRSTITGTSFQVTQPLNLGNYTAWVQAIDAGGIAARWSAPMRFTIATQTSLLSPLTPTFNRAPVFQWAAVTGATEYEIYIQDRRSSAVVNLTGISSTTWAPATNLNESDYRWWVRASRGNNLRGAWSRPADFNVSGIPVVLNTGTTSDRTPAFVWTAVAGAARYELWVSQVQSGQRVMYETQLTVPGFTPAQNLTPGSYRIWVRSVTSTSAYSAWSSVVTITITAADPGTEPCPGEYLLTEELANDRLPITLQHFREERSENHAGAELPGAGEDPFPANQPPLVSVGTLPAPKFLDVHCPAIWPPINPIK
jgi:hypothetical protein